MTDRLTPERESEIRARLEAITPGRWDAKQALDPYPGEARPYFYEYIGPILCAAEDYGEWMAIEATPSDVDLVIHAPDDMRALLAEVEALRSALAQSAKDKYAPTR